ncbi:MAG TPA: LemA family protein [Terriglobales bacterium]|nr:LemA family protein [Terriglobales bacterium]
MAIVVLLVLLFVIAGVIWYLVTIYNSLVELKNDIDKAWSNIDVLLKQRHDELTKLLDVVKGYAQYEQSTFQKITEARALWSKATTVDQKAQADAALTTAVRGLFAVAENYPELKANTSFMQLQGRITEIENSIADRREFYNDSVNTFNIRIAQFPDMIVAGMMHLTPRTLFKADEADKADVKMDFSTAAGKP